MKAIFPLLFLACLGIQALAQTRDGDIRTLGIGQVHTRHSDILQEDRELNIYLPASYGSGNRYPVIYLLDGSLNEDFLHISGLTQFFHMMFGMPECIVVGIDNIDRKRDYTFPTSSIDLKKTYPTTGRSGPFIRFIAEELQPYIDSAFATNSTRYLIGQSLGGLLATEILLKRPELFTHYFIVGPSLWWANESLLKAGDKLYQASPDSARYVYISAGQQEDTLMQQEAKLLHDLLLRSGKKNTKAELNMMAGENHATILHRSIYEAFERLFPYREPEDK